MSTDLIVQAEDIATPDLKALHALSGATGIARIDGSAHQAFRLANADAATRDAVAAHCAKAQLDFAFMPSGKRLADFGLIAMDMDSTLIIIECIDEIADFTGKKAEVAAITASAMRGEIDWPESLKQRVALLEGLDESVLQRVYDERLKLSPGAETLMTAAKSRGIKLLLVSGGFTFFTERLKARLGIDYAFSNQLQVREGKLTGKVIGPLCDADAKAHHLQEIAASLDLSREQCMAIGDGANDLKMMAAAELSIAYHAKPVVQASASVAINWLGLDAVPALFA
ncbi:MAG: phosphoserine phosphatase SerB [Betaproteobacteria bacterium]|nr:phosphoserine phosphatase SerB [Betaproteobacteria bacterium]